MRLIIALGALAFSALPAATQRALPASLSGKPNNLVLTAPTPPGPAPLPLSKPPASTMYVIDIRRMPRDWQRAMVTLQGLVNRRRPEIYCTVVDTDPGWLDLMKRRGFVKRTVAVTEPKDLLKRFRSSVNGVVVPDENLPASVNVAFMLASVNGWLVGSPDVAHSLGLPVKADLHNRWKTNAAAYEWAFDRLWPSLNHHLLSFSHENHLMPRDYLVQNKGFSFWVSGPIDGARPGADPTAEARVMERLLAKMPANIPVLGYPYAGENIGIGENPGVSLLARFGKYLIATDWDANLSVHSGIRIASFRQKHPPAPRLRKDKVYVSFIVSDGDNLQVYQQRSFPNMWESPLRGRIPVGWSMSPSAARLIPLVADSFYRAATPNDEFVAAVSGVGYTYPDDYAERYRSADRKRVWDGFLSQTAASMRQMDLDDAWIMGCSRPNLFADYAQRIPFLNALYPDYGRNVTTYADATFHTARGVPVFRAAANAGGHTLQQRVRLAVQEIHAITPRTRPAFLHIFLQNWETDLPTMKAILDALGPGYVAVRPDHMAALYRLQARSEGAVLQGPTVVRAVEGRPASAAVTLRNQTPKGFRAAVTATGPLKPSLNAVYLKPWESLTIGLSTGIPPRASAVQTVTARGPFGVRSLRLPVRVTPLSEIVGSLPAGPLRFAGQWEAETLPHRSGAEVADPEADGGHAWSIDPATLSPGEGAAAGFVVYGPYAPLTPGRFVALYRLKRTGEGTGRLARIDVAVAGGSRPLAERYITAEETPPGQYVSVALPFSYATGQVETRVEWMGTIPMAVDSITVFQTQ